MSRDFTAAEFNQAIVDFADSGRPFAVATILQVSGSTPREAGTKAIIDADGAIHGTIGGGQVEAEAQRRAVDAIRAGRAVISDFVLSGSSAKDAAPICGGSMRVLLNPTVAAHRATYAQAADAVRQRRRGVLLTHVDTAHECREVAISVQWFAEDSLPLDLHDCQAVHSAVASGTPQLLIRACRQTLVEPVIPPPLLIIVGGGHVGQALALQASLVGFQVIVMDDRPEFTDPSLYPPGTITRCRDIATELAQVPVAADTYIAIVTRGHQHDQRALAACVARPVGYLGMIGSRRKVALLRQALLDSGVATAEQFGRVHAPIGMDIGAESVPEIAVSIVAQLIAIRRRGIAPTTLAMSRSV
jgi:xanthine dehydrogenase accessory factor